MTKDYKDDDILSTKEAGEYIGYKTATLETWRNSGKGPKWKKTGESDQSRVGYLFADLKEWKKQRWIDVHPTTKKAQKKK